MVQHSLEYLKLLWISKMILILCFKVWPMGKERGLLLWSIIRKWIIIRLGLRTTWLQREKSMLTLWLRLSDGGTRAGILGFGWAHLAGGSRGMAMFLQIATLSINSTPSSCWGMRLKQSDYLSVQIFHLYFYSLVFEIHITLEKLIQIKDIIWLVFSGKWNSWFFK